MIHNPYRSIKPRTAKHALMDALIDSGFSGHAYIDISQMKIKIRGDYADLLLARRAVQRFGFEVEAEK